MHQQISPLVIPSLISSLQVANAAATPRVISHELYDNNPIFDTTNRYSSVSEWLSFHGRIMDIASNSTKECLSHLTFYDNSSLCFGGHTWKWDGGGRICLTTIIAVFIITCWLCCDCLHPSIVWYLEDTEDEEPNPDVESSCMEEKDESSSNWKEPKGGADSVLWQETDDWPPRQVSEMEKRIVSVNSQTTDDDCLLCQSWGARKVVASYPPMKSQRAVFDV